MTLLELKSPPIQGQTFFAMPLICLSVSFLRLIIELLTVENFIWQLYNGNAEQELMGFKSEPGKRKKAFHFPKDSGTIKSNIRDVTVQ